MDGPLSGNTLKANTDHCWSVAGNLSSLNSPNLFLASINSGMSGSYKAVAQETPDPEDV